MFKHFISAMLLIALAACSVSIKPPKDARRLPDVLNKPLWEMAKASAQSADKSTSKEEKARLAKDGIAYAEECLMKEPEEAACYYYRAVNTGLYYEAHVVGYNGGLSQMIKDCDTVIKLNESYDHGGAHRILGKIYMEVPETTLIRNGVRRDIELSIQHLKRAAQIDPNYPENHLYLAEAMLAANNNGEATASFNSAVTLLDRWKNHEDYAYWMKTKSQISKKLK